METGIRIPLSLGLVKEDRDKKGDPVQCYDFIFNTKTVKDAQKDATFRQSMVEVCFGYVAQKFQKQLDYGFTIPKMKYKGATIQWQRVKVKKTKNLVEEVQMTDEERKAMEQRAFEEERRKEAMREKEPEWSLFCVLDERLNKEFANQAYLESVIKNEFENGATGDDQDRWSHLQENFTLKEQLDVLEEYEGTNHEEAFGLVV